MEQDRESRIQQKREGRFLYNKAQDKDIIV